MNLNTYESANIGDRKAAKRVRAVLRSIITEQPFFGNLCLKMPLIEDGNMDTIAGNGSVFRYNPEWVNENKADKIKFAMARIVTGCALKHHTRRNDRDMDTWQRASLEACLPILEDSGYLPAEYEDRTFSNKSAEKIYDDIYVEQEEPEKSEGDEGGDDGGNSSGSGQPGNQDDSGEGEGSNGDSAPSDPNGNGIVLDAPKDVDESEEEQKWDENVAQAEQFSITSNPGKQGGSMKDKMFGGSSQMNWRDILRQYLNESAKDDYSWTRPNKRYIHSDIYLPSLYSIGAMGSVVFVIDTSYSMSKTVLDDVWEEIRTAVDTVKPSDVRVVQCDTRVTHDETFEAHDLPEELTAKGRGGTCFIPAFKHIEKNLDVPPKVMIYLTDLEVCDDNFPKNEPEYPVIWAYYNDDYDLRVEKGYMKPVPFGETIRVDGQ